MKTATTILFISLCVMTSGADASRIVPFILRWEGGYARLPHDPGGETNKGVTLATWQRFYGSNSHDEFIKMPADKWGHIFKVGYWDKVGGDSIKSQRIAELLAEWCWMSGEKVPSRAVQQSLGITADWQIGTATIHAINAANEQQLYEALIRYRMVFTAHLPQWQSYNWRFIDGWLNRLTALIFYQQKTSQ